MKKYTLILILWVFFLIFSTFPALAGTVTLDNTNGPLAYKVRIESYVFGIPSNEYICAEPKETKYFSNVLSVGVLYVDYTENCANFTRTFNIAHPYRVPGTWLPHRGFKIVIDKQGHHKISEQ